MKLEAFLAKKQSYFNAFLFAVAFFLTVVCILTGSYLKDKENIEPGMISSKRYVSPRDAVDTAATNQLKQEAMASVGPLYKHDTHVQETCIETIQGFFSDMETVLQDASLSEDGSLIYDKDAVLKLPVVLSSRQYKSYYTLSAEQKKAYQSDIITIANYVLDQGVTSESMPKAMELVADNITKLSWSSELMNMAELILSAAITPNLVLDEEAMTAARETKASEVSDIIIRKNQKIVDEGEIITEKIYGILNELNLINQNYTANVVPIAGSMITATLLFFAAALYFSTQQKKLLQRTNEMMILFVVYLLMLFILRLTADIPVYAIIPVSLFSVLISMLVSTRVAVLLNVFVAIIGTFIFNGNMEFLLYFILTGTFSALLVQFTEKRNHTLLVASSVGVINAVAYLALAIFFEGSYTNTLLLHAGYSSLTGILTVVIAMGSLPIWENVFDVNTQVKLLELTNPDNELLRRLMIEAPGTYHHCLIVANLAETAAYEIDGNPTLARVGAYFHDIGKLHNPLYFAENQGKNNPHDLLPPMESATIIKDHITYGSILAEEASLPNSVKAFIVQHHGTTMVKFFYYKACKENPDSPPQEADFRYVGPRPQSKETAIVMLADTVEAAVRSTIKNGKDLEQVETLIASLIKDKLDDGQLEESNLTIKDLTTIRLAFLKVFQGMYHDRITYPKAEDLAAVKVKK